MKDVRTIVDNILEVSSKVPYRSQVFVLCKLMEEISEANDAVWDILWDHLAGQYRRMTEQEEKAKEPFYSEICDVLNSVVDLLYVTVGMNVSGDQIIQTIRRDYPVLSASKRIVQQNIDCLFAGATKFDAVIGLGGLICKSLNQPQRSQTDPKDLMYTMIMACLGILLDLSKGDVDLIHTWSQPKLDKWLSKALE